MNTTTHLKCQHRELRTLLDEFERDVELHVLRKNFSELLRQLRRICDVALAHLSLEDKLLYPKLQKAKDVQLQQMAERFIVESGGLAPVLKDYVQRWLLADSAQQNISKFLDVTEVWTKALRLRMDVEDQELYPAIEPLFTELAE